jgi:PAS domain-containing protein
VARQAQELRVLNERPLTAQLTSELSAMTRMQQVSARLVRAGDFSTLLHDIIDAAIEITEADMGNIQLLKDGALKIVAQRGGGAPFLDFFDMVHEGQAASGAARQKGERVIVEDVANSHIFAGTPALEVMLAAGARAVQSTPLVSRSGHVLGMFSTHYRAPRRASEHELRQLDVLARQAADFIERKRAEEKLRESEERFRNMADNAPVMVWVTEPGASCVYLSKSWRILQKALQNVQKHAVAEHVNVSLQGQAGQLALIIEDDGQGYGADEKVAADGNKGMGVTNRRERAALIGGSLEIESAPGKGTTIFVRRPLAAPGAEGVAESE